jgi:GDP-4-dehydro-6-deoxy-D-mannose reductase
VRALVTGGHGFVGRWLCAHLEESGDEVVAPHAEDLDVTDLRAVRTFVEQAGPEAVYHLAGVASVADSWKHPDTALEVNAGGTLAVLEGAGAMAEPPRVLVISSAEVYGAVGPEGQPITEDAPLRPVSPYAASKVAAEFLGLQAFLGNGVPVVRARPFNHVGPGQSPGFVVAALARRIAAAARRGDTTLAVGNLTPRRDFTDVRDVVRAYRLLVLHGEPGEAYNVCSGRDVMVAELVERLMALAGVSLDLRRDPDLVRPVDIPVMRGDASRLQALTGWRPEVPIDRTLADVLAEASRPT